MSAEARLRELLDERIVVLDGAWGTMLQEAAHRRRRLSRRALPRPPARGRGRPRPAQPDAAGRRARRPPTVSRGGRRRDDDEHLHGHAHRPGGLRARGRRPRAERRGRAARPAGRGRGGQPLRRRLSRPAQRHAVALAARGRARLQKRHLRRGQGGICGADRRARGGRGRPPPRRDDLRHAERQGGDRRGSRGRARAAALDLGHDRRPERPDALGPDARGLLGLDRARAPAASSASTARSARRRCARTSRSSPHSPTATRAVTRTRDCRTRSAATTSSRTRRPRSCASSPRPAS